MLISLTIGAAGFAGAALSTGRWRRSSARTEAPPADALSESMRAVLEREKMLVLRSIKELEFDRAMGKVSPKDFDEMAGRLRARAMSLMRQLDTEAGYRELIERELQAQVEHSAGPREAPGRPGLKTRHSSAAQRTCCQAGSAARCGTANDADAAFCKRCGAKLDGNRCMMRRCLQIFVGGSSLVPRDCFVRPWPPSS